MPKFIDLPPAEQQPSDPNGLFGPTIALGGSRNAFCKTGATGPFPLKSDVTDLITQMHQNIDSTTVGIDSSGLIGAGKRQGGCQLVYSTGKAGAYLCSHTADAPRTDCGDFNGGDFANAVGDLADHCNTDHVYVADGTTAPVVLGSALVNGKAGQKCDNRDHVYFVTVRSPGRGTGWQPSGSARRA